VDENPVTFTDADSIGSLVGTLIERLPQLAVSFLHVFLVVRVVCTFLVTLDREVLQQVVVKLISFEREKIQLRVSSSSVSTSLGRRLHSCTMHFATVFHPVRLSYS